MRRGSARKHPIGQAKNGVYVYADLIGSPAGKHIARQPQLLTLAKEMLSNVILRGSSVSMEYDMKRLIGYNFIVETSDEDSVFYACLLKDELYTRFVKNGKPSPTSHITVVLAQDDQGDYELSDIWIGRLTPPLPGDSQETVESKPYWSNHALILNGQFLQAQTVSKTCPY